MRLRDENKRRHIIETAVKLFSEQPFHKVRLDDVAEAAGVGKGTVYIYFKNKEELYYNLVYEGFAGMVDHLHAEVNQPGLNAAAKMRTIVAEMVEHFILHPQFFEVLRTVGVPDANSSWDHKRKECADLIEQVIREGIASGEFSDNHPERTGLYLMAMVRAVMLYRAKVQDKGDLTEHITSVLLRGIGRKGP
ncbi:MAG: TetR/AcrR family transcriptional regulator [Tepidisphaeraceae bacterium]|jgi:AcrR family transcriptional regulator